MNQNIDDSERDAIFAKCKTVPENNKCFDCDKKNPKWASVYLGLYLCLDCAGKHREYGPQVSFARSLNLDTWNRRYITFMELGGNVKASEYFRKLGLKTPYDYKNPQIQKYKQELTKKVDAALGGSKAQEEASKPVFTTKAEEDRPQNKNNELLDNTLAFKSYSDKPKHGEKPSDDPFASNIVINKDQIKKTGFTVDFSKNKSNLGSNKGRLAAKKIDNVDLDALTLNEDGSDYPKNNFDMTESAFGTNKNEVKEVYAKSNSPYTPEQANDEKFKKFQNAKAISSDSFRTDNNTFGASNVQKFSGASSISSAQYFGEKEGEKAEEGVDYYEAAENVKDFFSKVGGKLKQKADGLVNKMKEDWS